MTFLPPLFRGEPTAFSSAVFVKYFLILSVMTIATLLKREIEVGTSEKNQEMALVRY